MRTPLPHFNSLLVEVGLERAESMVVAEDMVVVEAVVVVEALVVAEGVVFAEAMEAVETREALKISGGCWREVLHKKEDDVELEDLHAHTHLQAAVLQTQTEKLQKTGAGKKGVIFRTAKYPLRK